MWRRYRGRVEDRWMENLGGQVGRDGGGRVGGNGGKIGRAHD